MALETCSYGLDPKSISPYTPEQNWTIDRLFDSRKPARVCALRFASRDEAVEVIASWMDQDDARRPHAAPDDSRARFVA